MPSKNKNTTGAKRAARAHSSFKQFSVFFISLAILFILGLSYIALAKVTITLIPRERPATYEFNLLVNSKQTDASAASINQATQNKTGSTPTAQNESGDLTLFKTVNGLIISQSKKVQQVFPVHKGKTVADHATGEVTVYNQRAVPQTLVATTRLLSPDGVLIRLKNKIIVPAHGELKAEVYADQPGASGELAPTTFTIPGLSPSLQKLVYARSTQPLRGGTKKIGQLTAAEVKQAVEELKKTAGADILSNYLKNNNDLTLLGVKLVLDEVQVEPKIGSETDNFTVSGTLKVKAVYAPIEKIISLAKTFLQEKNGKLHFQLIPSSLKYDLITVNPATQKAVVKVTFKAKADYQSDSKLFDKNILIGFTENDLKLYFSQFDFIKDVQVKFSPFWVKKVPILKDHIIIKIAK